MKIVTFSLNIWLEVTVKESIRIKSKLYHHIHALKSFGFGPRGNLFFNLAGVISLNVPNMTHFVCYYEHANLRFLMLNYKSWISYFHCLKFYVTLAKQLHYFRFSLKSLL